MTRKWISLLLAGILLVAGVFVSAQTEVIAQPVEKSVDTFVDTSFCAAEYLPLRIVEGGREELCRPTLAGDWLYYEKLIYDDDGEMGFDGDIPSGKALCRCRAEDLSGEEVLSDDPLLTGMLGMRDIGDGILMWDETSEYDDEGYLGADGIRLWIMDYDGGEPRLIAEQPFEASRYGSVYPDLLLAGREVYFSWYDFYLDWDTGKTEWARGEIWRLSLDDPTPRLVYGADWNVYPPQLLDGWLYFSELDHDPDEERLIALDPDTGERRVLFSRAWHLEERTDLFGICGRLYYWDEDARATMSIDPDGSDVRWVCGERFDFRQAAGGWVLANRLTLDEITGMWYNDDGAGLYRAADFASPDFDPDRCERIGENSFLLGNRLYRWDGAGWSSEPLE